MWVTPKTWAVGDVLTASDMNQYVRDNENFLYSTPKCKVNKNAATSVGNSATVTVSWDAITFETPVAGQASHWGAGVPQAIYARMTGKYLCVFSGMWDSNSTGARVHKILVNGFPFAQDTKTAQGSSEFEVTGVINMAAGDYISATVLQSSGGTINFQYAGTACCLSLFWQGN